jgi:malonyl-CoA/methylmalonyl-CoA synthetase
MPENSNLHLVARAQFWPERTAIISNGQHYTYQQLLTRSIEIASSLLGETTDLKEARIAFMVTPGFEYVATQWGIWRAGGIAVPLCTSHPLPSLQYVIEDTEASVIISDKSHFDFLQPLSQQLDVPLLVYDDLVAEEKRFPNIVPSRRAMILYTSGTTSLPKGVVSTHKNIESQIQSLIKAWKWQAEDHILNILPLHHVHGIINILSCALWSGACCEFLPKFDAAKVWELFQKGQINVFMAVPTIYYKLIAYWESVAEDQQKALSKALHPFRLMVSGSAALPVSTLEKWRTISGHTLLERYGMTEIGMALSNPYDGERRPGHVGLPLPGVEMRLVDTDFNPVAAGTPGEIQIKGPNVFLEYWRKPEATKAAFVDGWFQTGDIAQYDKNSYKILGRNSVDIIKSGGYKISALEIEEVLRRHPDIKECAVVGLPDEEWGEIVAAGLVSATEQVDFEALQAWLKDYLPGYKVPRRYKMLDELPRNTLGKVTKNELKKNF